MAAIPFAEWRPDMPALGPWAREARNVVPAEESYRPLNALAGTSAPLPQAAQGAAWFRGSDGGTRMFAGDASRLYRLSGTDWNDVSRSAGGPYAPGADHQWRFGQFGALALAVNGVDVPQKFDLGVGARWTALEGAPPVATYLATVRDFVVLGKIGNTPQRIQWSGFNNAETWGSALSTQADLQDLPDGGTVTGLVGGEYGLVFQETSVRRMTYEGPPVVFRIDKIANDIGASVPGSVAGVLDLAFFLHKSGFYMVQGGQSVVPIGRGKVDRTFWADFDELHQFRCSSAIDPVRGLYVFAYPGAGSTGRPNRLLIYNWRAERWSRAELPCELVFGGASQDARTLEQLDSFGALQGLPYSLDSSYWIGTLSLLLFGFDTDHRSGSFSGGALEATLETGEFNPGAGNRSVIRGLRPLIDGDPAALQLGARETQRDTVAYGPPVGVTAAGLSPVYGSGRYFRVRATIPAASTWSNAQGIDDIDVRPAGAQ
ncbi:MAG: hypothetical protein LCH95_00710 [Proteobacteria bacterium]|nr:hypothetical protein [Pseudomonadota bacterium]